ncbi:hypothetical protein E8L90_27000 [Brevibacillus antibioticus]|uniref:Uncharacterized protein n=2 Tax=Brevibacillus antibioticus TaxID=2570228 RepID=A0A4U2YGS1_9BACL|nr:hypothetical protein E8L90_27000 [Brevibacillus antibioticus]
MIIILSCRKVIPMLKSKILIIFTLLFSLIVLPGCGTDAVQEDLLNYINNEVPKIASLEKKAIADYSAVSEENFQDDDVMYETLIQKVIPTYAQFIGELEKISPSTPEVQEVHERFIAAATSQYSGFVMVVSALEKQDYAEIAKANANLAEGRKLMREYHAAVKNLADSHGVTITLSNN